MELFLAIKKDILNGINIKNKYNDIINKFDKILKYEQINLVKYVGFNNNSIDYSSVYLIDKNNKNKKQLNYVILKENNLISINIFNEYIIIKYYISKLGRKRSLDNLINNSDIDSDSEEKPPNTKVGLTNNNNDENDDYYNIIYKKENNKFKQYYLNLKEILLKNNIISLILNLKNNDLYNILRCKRRYNYYYEQKNI
tara:strand:+ start:1068 stop:1661 length:594 start_codon:yes stop_codon:yes gene_type:complete